MSKKHTKKKGSRGKSKGNAFERTVSSIVDGWWKVTPKTFWRTSNSGGWKPEPGDIAPRLRQGDPVIWWPFVCECKFYKNINFAELLENDPRHNRLLVWWEQCIREKAQVVSLGRNPEEVIKLLIFKANFTPIYVAYDPSELARHNPEIAKLDPIVRPELTVRRKDHFFVITTLDVFIKAYTKEKVYQIFRKETL